MKLSTRSRYGVRLMLSLALSYNKGQTLLKDIAKNEEISEKYLSIIIISLKAAGLVQSVRGAHGGYTLAKPPDEITIKEIVSVMEGDICIVDCIKDMSSCSRSDKCATRDIWAILSDRISQTLDSITLKDLTIMSKEKGASAAMYFI